MICFFNTDKTTDVGEIVGTASIHSKKIDASRLKSIIYMAGYDPGVHYDPYSSRDGQIPLLSIKIRDEDQHWDKATTLMGMAAKIVASVSDVNERNQVARVFEFDARISEDHIYFIGLNADLDIG